MTLTEPPQRPQTSMSILNTRLSRWAQVIAAWHSAGVLTSAFAPVLSALPRLDVIAESDWVIDMGPEGGSGGGKVVAQGKPAAICKRKRSYTGKYLQELLKA